MLLIRTMLSPSVFRIIEVVLYICDQTEGKYITVFVKSDNSPIHILLLQPFIDAVNNTPFYLLVRNFCVQIPVCFGTVLLLPLSEYGH